MNALDEKDRKILELLRQNAKLTTQQISKKTLIPITTVHNRIKKMESTGIIKGYTVLVDHKKLGKDVLAFILLAVSYVLPSGKKISQADLAKAIGRMPEVEEVHIVTGGTDIIIKIRVKDMDELNTFVITRLRNLEGVENTQTIIALSTPNV
ncbi:MAG: Lrp/AsnC family transcriptional regulator [Candidatus Aenigmarchaeota archaeon]|nr:Lrp/AsnC family transcriptional regulator [Candidatus Aenigmarchaeota archaeon]